MGGAAWTAVEYQTETPWEPAIFLLGAVTIWITSELKAEEQPEPELHPHDIALAKELQAVFTPRLRGILRDFDFRNSFDFQDIEPLGDIRDWEGPEHEFEDEQLNRKLDEIIQICTEIYTRIIEDARPLQWKGRRDSWTFATEEERYSDFFGRETFAKISEVNRNTSKLLERLHDFERLFRKLSPASSMRDA
jgi:hypothetical protein